MSKHPPKTFNVTKLSSTDQELHHQTSLPLLHIHKKHPFFGPPVLYLHSQSRNGRIVAAAKVPSVGGGVFVVLGDPESASSHDWTEVTAKGFITKEYVFAVAGRRFIWRRESKVFKLLDLSSPNEFVIATYTQTAKTLFNHNNNNVGRIEFLTELGRDLELLVLATIIGIEERLRRKGGATAM